MLPQISLLGLIIATFTSLLLYTIFNLYVRPSIKLLHYKRQGIPTKFHPGLTFMPQSIKDLHNTGEFFHGYQQLVRSKPDTKAVAENFMSKVRLTLFDPDMIRDFLKRYDVFHKETSFIGLCKELALSFAEGAYWKSKRKLFSEAFNFEFLKHKIS